MLLFICNIFVFSSALGTEEIISASILSNKNLSQEDNLWMLPFVKDFFMKDIMIYTLFGTKPMTTIQITNMSKDECLNLWKPVFNNLENEKKEILRKKIDKDCSNATVQNYYKWIAVKSNNPFSPFLFRAAYTNEDKKYLMVSIINVRETVWTLQKNHELFSRETGMEFDSLEVAQDFENSSSPFWIKVLSNTYLSGVLYGYGERNAYFFSKMTKNTFIEKNEPSNPLFQSQFIQLHKLDFGKELSLENLDIPHFRSFNVPLTEDPVITHYRNERELIIKELQGKNLLEEVIKKLLNISGSDSP